MSRSGEVATSAAQQQAGISAAQREAEAQVTARVLEAFAATPDERLGLVMSRLVVGLHELVREVRLTESEWQAAVDFLTAAGQISDERRQELILLSDVLGASMLTVTVNNPVQGEATEATVVGPFFLEDAPELALGADIAAGAPGQPCWVHGRVSDTSGEPVGDALIEVWEADEDGFYDVQYDERRLAARARLRADADGAYRFWGLTPTPYPIPHDGPVGRLLAATGRSVYRAPHLHFRVSAPGRRTLTTHIFLAGGEYLDRDAVFGVKDSLIKDFEVHEPSEPTPDGREVGESWTSVCFDIVLADSEVA